MTGVDFRAPEFLVAVLLLMLPLLVHGWRYVRVGEQSFVALQFLLKKYPTRFRRFHTLGRVLLVLRILLLASLVVLFMLPEEVRSLNPSRMDKPRTGVLLLIDDSAAMAELTPEGSLLDLALSQAFNRVFSTPGDRFAIASFCSDSLSGGWLTREAAQQRILEGIPQKYMVCPVDEVIQALVRELGNQPMEILVFSSGAPRLPLGIGFELVPVGQGPRRINSSILDLRSLGPSSLEVVLMVRGKDLTSLQIGCGEGGAGAGLAVDVQGHGLVHQTVDGLPRCPDGYWSVSLEPDELEIDNHGWLPIPRYHDLEVLLVDGSLGTGLEPRSTRYLEAGLAAINRGDLKLSVIHRNQEALTAEDMEHADVVILADPHPIRKAVADFLNQQVEKGKGLIITSGARLARWRSGEPLIGISWKEVPVPDQAPLQLMLSEDNPGEGGLESLGTVRVPRRLLIEGRTEEGLANAAVFEDGVPAVVRWTRGLGAGFLWLLSADPALGDVPLSVAMPVLLAHQLRFFRDSRGFLDSLMVCRVGRPCDINLAPGEVIYNPAGSPEVLLEERLRSGDLTLQPGPYFVESGSSRKPVLILTWAEGTFRNLGEDSWREQSGAPLSTQGSDPLAGASVPVPFMSWVLLVLGALFLLEGLVNIWS